MCCLCVYSRTLGYINLNKEENGFMSMTTLNANQREYLYRHSDGRYSDRQTGQTVTDRQAGVKQSISLRACCYSALSQSADSDLVCSKVLVVTPQE